MKNLVFCSMGMLNNNIDSTLYENIQINAGCQIKKFDNNIVKLGVTIEELKYGGLIPLYNDGLNKLKELFHQCTISFIDDMQFFQYDKTCNFKTVKITGENYVHFINHEYKRYDIKYLDVNVEKFEFHSDHNSSKILHLTNCDIKTQTYLVLPYNLHIHKTISNIITQNIIFDYESQFLRNRCNEMIYSTKEFRNKLNSEIILRKLKIPYIDDFQTIWIRDNNKSDFFVLFKNGSWFAEDFKHQEAPYYTKINDELNITRINYAVDSYNEILHHDIRLYRWEIEI